MAKFWDGSGDHCAHAPEARIKHTSSTTPLINLVFIDSPERTRGWKSALKAVSGGLYYACTPQSIFL
jgi:hypothetical protein